MPTQEQPPNFVGNAGRAFAAADLETSSYAMARRATETHDEEACASGSLGLSRWMYGQPDASMQQQLMVRRVTRRAPRVARPSF